jgi:hypothetical protein
MLHDTQVARAAGVDVIAEGVGICAMGKIDAYRPLASELGDEKRAMEVSRQSFAGCAMADAVKKIRAGLTVANPNVTEEELQRQVKVVFWVSEYGAILGINERFHTLIAGIDPHPPLRMADPPVNNPTP